MNPATGADYLLSETPQGIFFSFLYHEVYRKLTKIFSSHKGVSFAFHVVSNRKNTVEGEAASEFRDEVGFEMTENFREIKTRVALEAHFLITRSTSNRSRNIWDMVVVLICHNVFENKLYINCSTRIQ